MEGEAAVRGWPASRRANGGSLRGSLASPARPITRGSVSAGTMVRRVVIPITDSGNLRCILSECANT